MRAGHCSSKNLVDFIVLALEALTCNYSFISFSHTIFTLSISSVGETNLSHMETEAQPGVASFLAPEGTGRKEVRKQRVSRPLLFSGQV